jgi:hypothetical protein
MTTRDIWSMRRKRSRIELAENWEKASAQSPPWTMKASPRAAAARRSCRLRHSPAKTSGGYCAISAIAASLAACGRGGGRRV